MATANNTRHRSFKIKKSTKAPITFDIGGEDTDGNEFEELFTARADVPGAVILDLAVSSTSKKKDDEDVEEGEDAAKAAESNGGPQAIIEFFEVALEDESLKRFNKLIRDPKKLIPLESLTGIIEYLAEEYASRPTEAS